MPEPTPRRSAGERGSAVERIRAELEAATPGPWRVWKHRKSDGDFYDGNGVLAGPGSAPLTVANTGTHRRHNEANATLIAHAPTYLAALLDIAEAHKELFEFLEVEHWCIACEAKQEHDQGKYCPLTQRLIASRNAHAALEATP